MTAVGFVRKVDELGRIVLPIELRKSLGIAEKDSIEFFTEGEKIILKKYQPGDVFTGETEDLVDFKGRKISRKNIEELSKLIGLI